MKKLQVLIMFFLIVGCVSTNKEITNVLFSKTDFCTTNEETAFNNSIIGCWGNHIETGNSILCITDTDSLFWVDPSLWCTYSINNDTITMNIDTFIYFQGRIEIRNDTLILMNSDFSWEYERYKE